MTPISARRRSSPVEPRIVKWWMPDAVLFDTVPLTATGKIDKKLRRKRYASPLSK